MGKRVKILGRDGEKHSVTFEGFCISCGSATFLENDNAAGTLEILSERNVSDAICTADHPDTFPTDMGDIPRCFQCGNDRITYENGLLRAALGFSGLVLEAP